jgi:hypothetical protein
MSDIAYFLFGAAFGLGIKILIALFDTIEQMLEERRKK